MVIKKFVLEYFEKKTKLNKEDLLCDVNYFKEGYIDSLLVFELITTLENQFSIEFNDDDFQNRDFATINGVSKIIEKKIIAL